MQKRFKVIRLAEKMRCSKPSANGRKQRKNHQGHSHIARRFVNVNFVLVKSRLTEKRKKYQPEHIERRQPRASQPKQPKRDVSVWPRTNGVENFVFAEESSKARNSRNRKRANEQRPESHRNLFSQPAHVAHVLLAAHGMYHAAGGQEEQAFEERVRHQMKNPSRVRSHSAAEKHIAQLRHGRVSQNFFNVGLHQPNRRRIKRSDRSHCRHHKHRDRRSRKERMHACHHVNARGHHRRRRNQRAHRRRTFHRVRQPDVQRQLRRLSNCAGKKQQTNPCEHARLRRALGRHIRGLSENRAKIHRTESPEEQQNSDGKSEVANSRGNKRLFPGVDRRLFQEPESNKQVAAQPHAFPAHKHQNNIRRQHQRKHEKHKQIQVGEKSVVPLLVRHVSSGINVHEQTHKCDHQQHHDRQVVHLQRKVHLERPRRHPVEIILEKRKLSRRQQRKFSDGLQHAKKSQRNGANSNRIYNRLGAIFAQQAIQCSPGQRQRENDPKMFEYWHQNFRRFTR